MAVVPTGNESLPLKNLKDLLEASTTFQSWAAISGRVHYVGDSDPTALDRPYAIVGFVQDEFVLRTDSAMTNYVVDGAVALLFFADVNIAHDIADQVLTFTNKTGAIIKEMADLARGSAGTFAFTRCERVEGPRLKNEDDYQDEPDFITSAFIFYYADSPTA